jgi:hypothetical protein
MAKINVRPAPARKGLVRPDGTEITHRVVRHPVSRLPISPEGEKVELNAYIRRRIEDEDLVAPEAELKKLAPGIHRRLTERWKAMSAAAEAVKAADQAAEARAAIESEGAPKNTPAKPAKAAGGKD